MSGGWTKGPWRVEPGLASEAKAAIPAGYYVVIDGEALCWIQRADDAHLIAAAPELAEALEECVKRLRACARLHGNAPFAVDSLCEQFEKVVAKAKGLSS